MPLSLFGRVLRLVLKNENSGRAIRYKSSLHCVSLWARYYPSRVRHFTTNITLEYITLTTLLTCNFPASSTSQFLKAKLYANSVKLSLKTVMLPR